MASKKKKAAKPEHVSDVVDRTMRRVRVEWLQARVKEAENAASSAKATPAQHKAAMANLRSWLRQLKRAQAAK